jgi:hypothetical protein
MFCTAILGNTGQSVQSNTDSNPITSCSNGVVTNLSTAAGTSTQSTSETTETSSIQVATDSVAATSVQSGIGMTSSNIPTDAQYFTTEQMSPQSSLGSTSLATSGTDTPTTLNNAVEYTSIAVAGCICTCVNDGANMTESELQHKIETRKRALEVNKSSLSSTIRKKESAFDPRPSAKGIGYVGAIVIAFVFGGIVLMDLHRLYVFIVNNRKQQGPLDKRVKERQYCSSEDQS